MTDGIVFLGHNSIKLIGKNKVIYVDPFKLEGDYNDADVIFVTHSHYDHFSKEDILKVKKVGTKIVITEDLINDVLTLNFKDNDVIVVSPDNNYNVNEISFSTVSAYNVNKDFHPKDKGWVGYNITLDNLSYFIVGDSDITEENEKVKCDVLFVPIGGVYTTDYKDAAALTNRINPKVVIPVHYGIIIGDKEMALKFKELVNESIECIIMY